jgi:hypothetical protein
MATSAVEVANQAFALIGANAISSFIGTATEQVVGEALYQPLVDAALTSYRWRFATGKATLSRLAAVPLNDWDAAYQMPTDPIILLLNAVMVLDQRIEFDRYEDQIYCNATSDDTVIADYVYSAGEERWPPYFTKAVVFDLASNFAAGIMQDSYLASHFNDMAEIEYRKARFADGSSKTARPMKTNSLINRRRG